MKRPLCERKTEGRLEKLACKPVEQEENHEEGLRWSWARNQVGNPSLIVDRKTASIRPKMSDFRRIFGRLGLAAACLMAAGPGSNHVVYAQALSATADQAATVQNVSVTIPVLSNDQDAASNQLAILQVTQPANGTVIINTNGTAANAELARLLQFAAVQLSNTVTQMGSTNLFPRSTLTNGLWATAMATNDLYGWINGYFPGALWYVFEMTGDPHFEVWAQQWTSALTAQQYSTNTDDVGSILEFSFGNGYRLTTNLVYKAVLVQGAHSLTNRYNSVVQSVDCYQSLRYPYYEVLIDTLMNLELLYDGAALSGDSTLATKAYDHALRAMTNQVRADNGTFQEVVYYVTSGAVYSQGTSAGCSDTSTFSRGQAWGIYGFTLAFRETAYQPFAATAQRLANYYLTNCPADFVPYWDFQPWACTPVPPRDSSAAAITLSALIQLSQLTTNLSDSATDWLGARRIFSSLGSTNYLAQGTSSSGILLHGTGEPPQFPDPEVNVSLIYGDYYFVEALKHYTDVYRRTAVTYTPNPGFQGTDTFTYLACDSAGNCSTATVSVAVQPPTQPPFSIQIGEAPGAQGMTISFPSAAGRAYEVQYKNDLSAASAWINLFTNLPGSGSVIDVMDTNPANWRFYRVGGE